MSLLEILIVLVFVIGGALGIYYMVSYTHGKLNPPDDQCRELTLPTSGGKCPHRRHILAGPFGSEATFTCKCGGF